MSKVRTVNKEWEFVSKGTEISLGNTTKEDTIENVRENKNTRVNRDRFTYGRRKKGGKFLLSQQTRRLGDKQEDEENCSPLNLRESLTLRSHTTRICGR